MSLPDVPELEPLVLDKCKRHHGLRDAARLFREKGGNYRVYEHDFALTVCQSHRETPVYSRDIAPLVNPLKIINSRLPEQTASI